MAGVALVRGPGPLLAAGQLTHLPGVVAVAVLAPLARAERRAAPQ